MIEVIMCDDEKKARENIIKIIKSYMEKGNRPYKLFEFDDYNRKFMKLISEPTNYRIYILDIETPTKSGIDIAREIRKNDIDSIIIFLTGHEELGPTILQKDLNFLAFINKFVNCEERLNDALDNALKLLGKPRILKLTDNNTEYIIKFKDILYLTKDSIERKTVIKTTKRQYKVKIPMKELLKKLGDEFIQTHKSCIVHKKRIEVIDKSNGIITFDTGDTIDLLSDKYKKELIKNI